MTNHHDAVARVRASIAALEQAVAGTSTLLCRQTAGLEAQRYALRILEGEQDGTDPMAFVAVSGIPTGGPEVVTPALNRRSRRVTPEIDLTGVHVDFAGTENLLQRVIRVAETLPGQRLNVSQLAYLLIRLHESQAKHHNLSVRLDREIRDRPDLFERIETDRATYRYLGAGAHTPETPASVPPQAVTLSPNGRHDHE